MSTPTPTLPPRQHVTLVAMGWVRRLECTPACGISVGSSSYDCQGQRAWSDPRSERGRWRGRCISTSWATLERLMCLHLSLQTEAQVPDTVEGDREHPRKQLHIHWPHAAAVRLQVGVPPAETTFRYESNADFVSCCKHLCTAVAARLFSALTIKSKFVPICPCF